MRGEVEHARGGGGRPEPDHGDGHGVGEGEGTLAVEQVHGRCIVVVGPQVRQGLLNVTIMRQVPLERDINIAVNGCSGFATSTQKGPFMATL